MLVLIRLILVSIMVATKMHLDIQLFSKPIKLFSLLGGISVTELASMELEFCELSDFQLVIKEQEFNEYKDKLLAMRL